ncbi:bifunctional adenosylcobinamide kinase/adenosylcobinamide-phosphate guanylyltransferase [Plantactinospora sp. CA-290183]|uniref:bifunctional adenosylcobinamide kinase/adenosylcobinamide-phosphate guanylyltransferase n=1 Tax=Plantactinospora sp. CA-290183 TaxID=3240006 RepID=UPI003D8BCCEC
MAVDGWSRVLVLGGTRSGKSEFAEALVADLPAVRYVATAAIGAEDAEWVARIEAHKVRRPAGWTTEEANADPSRLAELISNAEPGETLLVDDLGGWVTILLDPAHQPADDVATVGELADAVRNCPARLVLVSPEVGLSLVPTTPLGRAFADAIGTTNQALAQVCDTVVLVVAGQPSWLKADPRRGAAPAGSDRAEHGAEGAGSATPPAPAAAVPAQAGPERQAAAAGPTPWAGLLGAATATPAPPEVLQPETTGPATTSPADTTAGTTWAAPTMALPMVATGLVIQPGMDLPMPDEYAGQAALDRLATLDLPGAGLGNLDRVVGFAAATQGTERPAPWRSVRVLLLHGDHAGGASAGTPDGDSARRAAQARAGAGPLARLAAEAGATLQVVEAPTAAPMEGGPALSTDEVEAALRYGWRLAEEAADVGVRLIVLGACGAGAEAAAAAVLAVTAGAEPAAVLGRVVTPGGQVDDEAWMRRCAAVRDALQRTRRSAREGRDVLAELGGGDIAIATGVLLGATARRTPVLLDGPVGVAAGLVSRDFAGQARHWCLLPDHGNHPAVRLAADVLGLTPLVDLRLDLGEGATALATLSLLRSALTLAGALPVHPTLADPAAASPADAGPTGPGSGTPGPQTPAPEAPAPATPAPATPAPATPAPATPAPEAPEGDDEEFVEPPPAGPGPATPARPAAPDDTAPDGATPDDTAASRSGGAAVPPGA